MDHRTGLKSSISGSFFIGTFVGVGCRKMVLGPRMGTLLGTLETTSTCAYQAHVVIRPPISRTVKSSSIFARTNSVTLRSRAGASSPRYRSCAGPRTALPSTTAKGQRLLDGIEKFTAAQICWRQGPQLNGDGAGSTFDRVTSACIR